MSLFLNHTTAFTGFAAIIPVAALREQRNTECKENAKRRQWRNYPGKGLNRNITDPEKQLTNNPFKPPNKQ